MQNSIAWLSRRWFAALVVGSVVLGIVTLISFPLEHHGLLSRVLFLLGYAGENDVGSWWQSSLLLLASLLAFDGCANLDKTPSERRGWLVLAAILLVLSLDEMASIHETLDLEYILVCGLAGLTATSYAVFQLYRGGVRRCLIPIVVAFALFGTVDLQEHWQHEFLWPNAWIYGLRALIEEGTEGIAMLLLVFATRANTAQLLTQRARDAFVAAAASPRAVFAAGVVLVPIMVAATFALPYPGGPADWLASALFFFCALLVVRDAMLRGKYLDGKLLVLLAFYLAAAVGANAMKLHWQPHILGPRVSVRALWIAFLLLSAGPVFRLNGRRTSQAALLITAVIALAASLRHDSQILWCSVPPCMGLWFFAVESRARFAVSAASNVRRPRSAGIARHPESVSRTS